MGSTFEITSDAGAGGLSQIAKSKYVQYSFRAGMRAPSKVREIGSCIHEHRSSLVPAMATGLRIMPVALGQVGHRLLC